MKRQARIISLVALLGLMGSIALVESPPAAAQTPTVVVRPAGLQGWSVEFSQGRGAGVRDRCGCAVGCWWVPVRHWCAGGGGGGGEGGVEPWWAQ